MHAGARETAVDVDSSPEDWTMVQAVFLFGKLFGVAEVVFGQIGRSVVEAAFPAVGAGWTALLAAAKPGPAA